MNPEQKRERVSQLRGALALLQAGIDHGSRRVEEMHLAIAKRPFDALRPIPGVNVAAGVVEQLHDGITHGVHAMIRSASGLALGSLSDLVEIAGSDGPADEDPSPAEQPRK